MTAEEYKRDLSNIEALYENDKKLLARQYAFSNAKYKIGDKIKDSADCILIDKIRYSIFNFSLPKIVYEGFLLKKDGTLRKDKSRRVIYEVSIVN